MVKHLGRVPRGVVEELEKLISIVDIKKFQPNKYIILNPDFNTLETAVRCADCDLIIDDTLIEIKTVKNGRSNSYFWKQLIGYYYLSKIGGINKPNIFSKEMELIEILEKSKYRKKPKLIKDIEIKRIGIYYSRYGILHIEPIDKIISSLDNHKALEKIMTEFVLVEPIQDNLTRKIVHSL